MCDLATAWNRCEMYDNKNEQKKATKQSNAKWLNIRKCEHKCFELLVVLSLFCTFLHLRRRTLAMDYWQLLN